LQRGPAGLLQGVGEPGGAVNLVRKRAPAKLSFEAGSSVGSFGLRRMPADLGSRLSANSSDNTLRGRLVAVKEHRESHVDLLFADKQVLYGTREWDLTPFTTLHVRAPAAQQGQVFAPFTPRQQINLGARYAFSDSTWHGLQGLSVGGGVSWRSRVYAQAQAGPVQVTSAANALANLNLAYTSGPHRRIRLAIENLFDKKYYEQVAGVNRQNFHGSPRSIMLSLNLLL